MATVVSGELLVWSIALLIGVVVALIWAVYRLFTWLMSKSVQDSSGRSNASSASSSLRPPDENAPKTTGFLPSPLLYKKPQFIRLEEAKQPLVREQELATQRSAVVQPVVKGRAHGNFLQILDRLSAAEENDEESDTKRRERKKTSTPSSSGIEAAMSDETASQTFIGKQPETRPDPGRIQLGLLMKTTEDDDNSRSSRQHDNNNDNSNNNNSA